MINKLHQTLACNPRFARRFDALILYKTKTTAENWNRIYHNIFLRNLVDIILSK